MKTSNETQATGLRLFKDSPEDQVKQYFRAVMELSRSSQEFPINLDDVWPLVYAYKHKAVEILKNEFVEGEDYIVQNSNCQRLTRKGESLFGGDLKSKTYKLSLPCLEYLVVRKIRPVFEIYRQVFHRVANGGVALFGDNKYYTLSEYCQMFSKTANSFYGLMAAYREEFAMIGRTFYISKPLCKMVEMRSQAERVRQTIKEKSDKAQLEFEFKETGGLSYGNH